MAAAARRADIDASYFLRYRGDPELGHCNRDEPGFRRAVQYCGFTA